MLLSLLTGGADALSGSPEARAEPNDSSRSVVELQKLIYPALAEEVKKQYGPYARIERYETQIRGMEKTALGDLVLSVQIMPFTGPHNSIALVDVKLICTADGVEVLSFEPVRTFAGSGRYPMDLTYLSRGGSHSGLPPLNL